MKIQQNAGSLTLNGGNITLEINGGESWISGSLYGSINHFGGGLSIGADISTLTIYGNYIQYNKNATLEIDIFSNSSYDRIQVVKFTFFCLF